MGNEDPRRQSPPSASWPGNSPPAGSPPVPGQPPYPPVTPGVAPNYPPYSPTAYPPNTVAPNPNYAAPAPPYAVPPAQYSPPNPPPSYYGQMPQSGQSPDNYPPGYQYPPQTPPSETPQSYSENPYQESQKNTAEPTLPQLNLEPNLAAALSYMFWVVSGAYFLFTERENQFVRFHAMQSIVFGAAWIMFYFVSSFFLIIISSILSLIGIPAVWKLFGLLVNGIYLIWFGIWIMLMYKAYNKETFSLPVLGDIASKQLKHWNKQL